MLFSDFPNLFPNPGTQGLPRRPEEMEVPILCYHRVVPNGMEDCVWTLGVEEFKGQIERLATGGYQTIALSDLHRWQTQRAALPAKPMILTFDDGQEGFFDRVAPILLEYNFRATLFPIAGMLGKEVHLMGGPPFRVMPREELVALAEAGFDIQSHGLNHRDWTRIGEEEVRREIRESARILEDMVERPVQFLAYPYGRWTRRIRELVESEGVLGACTVLPGSNGFRQDRFLLRRYLIFCGKGRYVWTRMRARAGVIRRRLVSSWFEWINEP